MTCFIVLHYIVKEQTIECVKSIQALEGEKKIIVVDNASRNGSGKELAVFYTDSDEVAVILNQENLGFARGNNVGCAYAKETYQPDYYVVMNNDVIVRQKDFIDRIRQIDGEEAFDVLGPDIFAVRTNEHQSPKTLKNMTPDRARVMQKKLEKKLKYKIVTALKYYIRQIKFIDRFYEKRVMREPEINWNQRHYNVPIQGSCYIFSKRFMEKRREAFFPGTFLYFEAEILDYECNKEGFKEIYDPSLQVYHYQNVSTISEHRKDIERKRFTMQHSLNSINAFLEAYGR